MVDRRTVLGSVGAMGMGLTVGQVAQARDAAATRKRVAFDPMNPAHNVMGYAKMHGSLDGRRTYHYSTGYIVGYLPGELPQQLTGFEQLKINEMQDNKDGTYTDVYSSLYMFTEIDKPVLLDSWTNPFTGRETDPFHYRSGPSRTLITPNGFKSVKNKEGSGSPDPFIMPWLIMGDTVFYRMNSATWFPSALDPKEWPLESPGNEMISSFLTTESGSLAELEDPDTPTVHTTGFVNAQSNWLPWMLMGKIPGSIAYHVVSQKSYSLDHVPAETLANVEKVQPGFLKDALELPYTLQYVEYKNSRKPVK